jgi:hypothetical protein
MPPGTDDGQDVADDPEGDYRRRHLRSDMPTRSGISEALQICRAAGQDRRRQDRRDEVRDDPQHVTPLPDECHRHEFSGQVRRESRGVDLVVEDALSGRDISRDGFAGP